ncbi:PREDICTED: uncharacterized protein LOC104803082 [Tarenaya hassleriana]|uniref:uncharacterized protein LOC104803082 n=1 Tax=Tarenaya hassleriana TaxID=28532 RepID=UPI00053C69E5|nr:PREDICTED: uncharacterized protein LOC104803082 [Tarenaya hassleriana]
MRCKRHVADLSSSVGVCASCLRERLLSLAVSASVSAADGASAVDHLHSRRPDPQHLAFPRSVSPYVAPRKSDAAGDHPLSSHCRFFSTPQVGPGPSSSSGGGGSVADSESDRSFKKKRSGFSRLSNLFRARSDEFDSGFKSSVSDRRLPSRHSCDASTSSSSSWSWFSTVMSGRMKKQPTSCFIEDVIADCDRRPQRVFCRGMSPARDIETDDERQPPAVASLLYKSSRHQSNLGLSWQTETIKLFIRKPGRLMRTAAAGTPARRKTRVGLGKSVAGMAICLSPLVRASPSRHWRRKGSLPPEFRFSGESKSPAKPHISTAASFCANRSKKLVDLGRGDHRR